MRQHWSPWYSSPDDDPQITFKGWQDRAQTLDLLRKADVLIAPSLDAGDVDGIPNIVLESMAVGTIICATTAGGLSEVISEPTGFVIRSLDHERFAETLDRCISQSDSWLERQTQARKRIEETFGTGLTVKELNEFVAS